MPGRRQEKIEVTKSNVKVLPNGVYSMGANLYLRVRGDRRNFFMRITVDGARRDVGIGSASDMSVTVAKAKAARLKIQIEDGARPWDEKKEKRQSILFRDFCFDAMNTYAKTRHWKREEKIQALNAYRLNTYILPVIGNIPIKKLSRDDVLSVISELWMKQPSLACYLRVLIEKICGIAMAEGIIDSNPAVFRGNLEFFLPYITKVHRVTHVPAATFDETKAILGQIFNRPGHSYHLAIVAIMTARRLGEIRLSKWKDWDFDSMIWTVPDEHMKKSTGVDRRVPIPRQLRDIMQTWTRHGGEGYVFSRDGKNPIHTSDGLRILKKFSQRSITVHGFRSVFSVWCAENGVNMEVAETCLDHEVGSKVRQAYQRSDLLEQRREVLQRYADALFEPTTD